MKKINVQHKTNTTVTGEMVENLRVLSAFLADPGLILSTHTVAHEQI